MIDLMWKDIVQVVRDWKAAVFMVAMPVAFTLLMGFIFGASEGDSDARLPVGFLDRDGSPVSAQLLGLMEGAESVRPEILTEEEAHDLENKVSQDHLAAALVVPAGYGKGILSGEHIPCTIVVDGSSIASASAQREIQAVVSRLLGSAEIARLSAQAYERGATFPDQESREAFQTRAIERAVAAWLNPPFTVAPTMPVVEQEGKIPSGFAHSSAGSLVQFGTMGVIGGASVIVLERRSRSLHRLLTTAISRVEILLGHFLAIWLLGLVQAATMVVFGDLVLGLGYTRTPLATAIVVVATTLWNGAMGLLIGVLAKSEEQVAMYSIISGLVLAGLGGAWMPLEITGEAFQTIGHLTPVAWAVDGLENLTIRGLGLSSIWLPAGVLLAYAVAFFALAAWRFRFE